MYLPVLVFYFYYLPITLFLWRHLPCPLKLLLPIVRWGGKKASSKCVCSNISCVAGLINKPIISNRGTNSICFILT